MNGSVFGQTGFFGDVVNDIGFGEGHAVDSVGLVVGECVKGMNERLNIFDICQ
jgi:hypothetical protein